jgi:two-component system phosphate regulon sensor histidine kinase PhoR
VAFSFKLPMQERGVRLDLQLDATHHVVTGDRVHLTNALFNLVDNALKYGPDNAAIQLRSRSNARGHRGGEFTLSVQDHGIGIRREDLKHIFERFYRVHTGNVHNVKGFGLGLHYVQQIAQAHNGGVSVHSEPGKGSIFTLSLPLADQAPRR